jgi:hypothetical protein
VNLSIPSDAIEAAVTKALLHKSGYDPPVLESAVRAAIREYAPGIEAAVSGVFLDILSSAAFTERLRKAISDGILFGVTDEAEKLGRRKARKADSA